MTAASEKGQSGPSLPAQTQWQRMLRLLRLALPWTLHLLLADVVLSLLLPVSALLPDWTYDASSWLAEGVWLGVQNIFEKDNRAEIIVAGDELPQGESAIVVSNHVEWCDFYLLQHLAIRAGMLGRCRWFAKQQLKWVPFLGWGLWAMGMPLVSRKWSEDKREMDRVFHGAVKRKWPIWLIAYSESTRYTEEKYAETVAWCKANDRPIPKHTLYPRTRGFIASVQTLKQASQVKAVYDVTVAYATDGRFMSPPTFADTLATSDLGKRHKMYVHVKRHDLASLPESSDEIAKWLEARWIEKGDLLEKVRTQLT